MVVVTVERGKIVGKFLDSNMKSITENLGYLNDDDQGNKIIINGSDTLSAAVADDLNNAFNGLADLTQNSLVTKQVEYVMKLSNQ